MSKSKQTTPIRDPHLEREAGKYERPIPSRELILEVLVKSQGPIAFEPLAEQLGLSEETDLEALRRRVRAMERDGQLLRNRRRAYLPVSQTDLVRGRVIGHADGFGFLTPDEGGDDLFLSPREMRSLLHGDRAVARVIGVDRRGRKEGALVDVLERNNHQVVGRYFLDSGIGFVVADNKRINQDILIPTEHSAGAGNGQIVIVAIMEQPNRRTQPIGKIVEILGEHMDPGMEIDIAIRAYELPNHWPDAVSQAANRFGHEVNEQAKQERGRVDLRATALVTIDGEDARDFDDAVYCEPLKSGWRLLVAIADVSHYVTPGDALDQEAHLRGTSVYFPERVIPMLPEALSNGLCSLNPQVDRLCMVCEMEIGPRGKIKEYRFYDAVMRSHARLTYDQVATIVVDRDADARQACAQTTHLDDLYALYQVLHGARVRRGAIDFETTETRIVFGEERKIERIVPLVRNDAHKVIEECMICANVAAASFLRKQKIPALNRIHSGPKPEKMDDLRVFLNEVGLSLGGGEKPGPEDYAEVLRQAQARPDARLIQTVLLRSLGQAVYSPEHIGHFGLAHTDYAHFTSPIRRYPDLLVHRAIRHLIRGGEAKTFPYTQDDMVALGGHCSMTERRADEATRDAADWLKCEFMLDRVGDEYEGIITAVTSFGLFVELNDIYVEGLVHITSLANDYYKFDPVGHRLTGERGGKVYRLGDSFRARVARVDLDERKIDFLPADTQPATPGQKKSSKAIGNRPKSKKKKGGAGKKQAKR